MASQSKTDGFLDLARHEAAACQQTYVGTEFLLLALAKIPNRPLSRAMQACGISSDRLRERINVLIIRDSWTPSRPLVPVPRVRRALEVAETLAMARHDSEVTPEHVLVALLDDIETVAYQLVVNLGCKPRDLQNAVRQAAGWN